MRWDYVIAHAFGTKMSRRRAVGVAARGASAAGAAALLGATGLHAELARAARTAAPAGHSPYSPGRLEPEPIDDTMFDPAAVEAGAWVPGPYGPGDQRGSFNEVTPEKTAEALRLLHPGNPVHTYNLGERLFNGFPAFPSSPPRLYDQRLLLSGYEPPPGYGGFVGSTEPAGPNRISGHEERFPNGGTYQIATQLDNLNHVGVGEMFYNGFRGPEMAETWGTNALGAENMGPLVTRGVVVDVLGLKQARGETSALSTAPNGAALLHDDYRITVEDIEAALAREGIREIRPGDVVLFRTGWTHLVRTDPDRYLAKEPGSTCGRRGTWRNDARPSSAATRGRWRA